MCRKKKIFIDSGKTFISLLIRTEKSTDEELFKCNDYDELGKCYYKILLAGIKNPKKQVFKYFQVLASRMGKNITTESDLYNFICNYYRIEKLPKTTLEQVVKLFNEIFKIQYKKAKNLYNNSINGIDKDTTDLKSKISKVNSKNIKFDVDTTEDIKNIKSLYRQEKLLLTKKEILIKSFNFVQSSIEEFCDLNNKKLIFEKLRNIAIKYSTYDLDIDIEFISYKKYLDALIYSIEKYDNLFYDNKFFPLFQLVLSETKIFKDSEEELKKFDEKNDALIQQRDLLINSKNRGDSQYLLNLENFLNKYNIIDKIKSLLNTIACLSNRKELLLKALDIFEDALFDVFNNILPIQIEGIFNDLMDDLDFEEKISERKDSSSGALKTKVDNIAESIPFEYVCYYGVYFNNVIRNTIAHGHYYVNENVEKHILSIELLIDLYSLLYMFSRYSTTETMYRYVENFSVCMNRFCKKKEDYFEMLYHDLTGQRTHMDYDKVEHYSAEKIIMWLINPYYEKHYLFKICNEKNNLAKLRQLLMGNDFWKYMILKLQKFKSDNYYLELEKILPIKPIINRLLGCNLPQETKKMIVMFKKELDNVNILDSNS